MNDATPAGDGPISTQPEGNPDFGMPGDSPLADSPMPEAPDLAPDSTEPAAPGDDAVAPAETTPPADDAPGEPPLPGETATDESPAEEPATDDPLAPEPADEPLAEGPAADEPTSESAPAEALPAADARPEPRRLSRGEREVVDRIRQRFAACGRCGYLIADLYLLLGEEALQVAAIAARDGWLRLEGDERLRGLLIDAFGVRLDMGYEAMDGACPECRRRFVFAALDDGRARLKLRT
jgi:hypothetical protein